MGNNTKVDSIYQMGGWENDIMAGPMYNQMMNSAGYYAPPVTNNGTNGTTQTSSGGGMGPLLWGAGTAGAVHLAGTQLGFFKPVGEDGKFTEAFLKEYSDVYTSAKNGDLHKMFYNEVGKDVNSSNFKTVLTDLERLGCETDAAQIEKAAKSNPLLKSVLEKNGIVDANGVLKRGKSIQNVRELFADFKYSSDMIFAKDSYIMQSNAVKRLTGLEDVWRKCTTREAQIKFLKENADILGLPQKVVENLHFNPDKVAINTKEISKTIGGCRNQWTKLLEGTKGGIQEYSKYWKKGVKWFEKGVFESAEKGIAEGLNKSYKVMLRRKLIIPALIAGIGAWAICKLSSK